MPPTRREWMLKRCRTLRSVRSLRQVRDQKEGDEGGWTRKFQYVSYAYLDLRQTGVATSSATCLLEKATSSANLSTFQPLKEGVNYRGTSSPIPIPQNSSCVLTIDKKKFQPLRSHPEARDLLPGHHHRQNIPLIPMEVRWGSRDFYK